MADTLGGFNLNDFRSKIDHDYHRTTHFHVIVGMPQGLARADSDANGFEKTLRTLHFDVEAVTMPGVAMATKEVLRYGYGVNQLKPYAPIFNEIDIIVRSDAEGKIYNFFQSWMKLVINYDTRNGIEDPTGFGGARPYEVNYKYDYACQMQVIAYDQKGDEAIALYLLEAWPKVLNDVRMSWGESGDIYKIPITFAFTDWHQTKLLGSTAREVIKSAPELAQQTFMEFNNATTRE